MEKVIFNLASSSFEYVLHDKDVFSILMEEAKWKILKHVLVDYTFDKTGCLYMGHIFDIEGVAVERENDTYLWVYLIVKHCERLTIDPDEQFPLIGTIISNSGNMGIVATIEFGFNTPERTIYYIVKELRDYGDWILYEGEDRNSFYNDFNDKRIRNDLDVLDF